MIDSELLAFVRQEIARGTPVREFSRILLNNGWTAEDIEHALTAATGQHFNTNQQSGGIYTYTFPSIKESCLEAVQVLRLHMNRFGLLMLIGTVALSVVFFGMMAASQLTQSLVVTSILLIMAKIGTLLLSTCVGISVIATILYPEESALVHGKRVLKDLMPFLWSMILLDLVLIGGTFLFVIPAIVMFFLYSLWPVVVIGEQVSGSRALARSRAFIAEHRGAYIPRFLCLGIVFNFIQYGIFALIDNTVGFIAMVFLLFVLIASSVLYHTFLTMLYRYMKFAYTGTIVPTARQRMLIIALAYIPILVLAGMIIFFFTLLKQLFERFV